MSRGLGEILEKGGHASGLTPATHNFDGLNENRRSPDDFSDLPESTHVCGKCAAMMPCSFKNPVAEL